MGAEDRRIEDWINDIRRSKIALPEFQRKEVWNRKTITSFLQAVVRDLPTGAALIYEVKSEPPFKYRYLEGAPDGEEEPDELLLDGQQRLTAIWKSLNNEYESRRYLVDFSDSEKPSVISKKRRVDDQGRKKPLWVDDPEDCWERDKVPIDILNPDKEASKVRKWFREAIDDREKRDKVIDRVDKIKRRIANFDLPYLYFEHDTDPDTAIDVFIEMNTSYEPLSPYSEVVARTEAATDLDVSLHERLAELKEETKIEDYANAEKFVLSAWAFLQDKKPTKTNYRELDYREMIEEWDKLIKGTKKTIEFFESVKIYDSSFLPTGVVVAPLTALFTQLSDHPDDREVQMNAIRKYFWRSCYTNRYDRSTNTRAYNDYISLKEAFNGNKDYSEIPCFNTDEHPLPEVEDLKNASWPSNKNRLGRAILITSFQKGGNNLAAGEQISRNNYSEREYHHLYPDQLLNDRDYEEEEIDKALNCIYIYWKDNRNISAKKPDTYLEERVEAIDSDIGEDIVKRRLQTHLTDYSDLAQDNYDNFLDSRATEIKEKAEKLCSGNLIS
jgi:hypothetical protein